MPFPLGKKQLCLDEGDKNWLNGPVSISLSAMPRSRLDNHKTLPLIFLTSKKLRLYSQSFGAKCLSPLRLRPRFLSSRRDGACTRLLLCGPEAEFPGSLSHSLSR